MLQKIIIQLNMVSFKLNEFIQYTLNIFKLVQPKKNNWVYIHQKKHFSPGTANSFRLKFGVGINDKTPTFLSRSCLHGMEVLSFLLDFYQPVTDDEVGQDLQQSVTFLFCVE